jgi:hypothetical protein
MQYYKNWKKYLMSKTFMKVSFAAFVPSSLILYQAQERIRVEILETMGISAPSGNPSINSSVPTIENACPPKASCNNNN